MPKTHVKDNPNFAYRFGSSSNESGSEVEGKLLGNKEDRNTRAENAVKRNEPF